MAPTSRPSSGRSRRRSVLVGTAAAAAAVAAAVAAALGVAAVTGDRGGPEPEVALRLSGEDRDPPPTSGSGTVGQPLPDDPYQRVGGGQASLAERANRPLVVGFFASWCEGCDALVGALQRLEESQGERLDVVGIDVGDRPEAVADLVEGTGVTFEVGLDPSASLLEAAGGVNLPTIVLASPDGVVAEVVDGTLTAEDLRVRAEGLLGAR